jgi:hypothetical protein
MELGYPRVRLRGSMGFLPGFEAEKITHDHHLGNQPVVLGLA